MKEVFEKIEEHCLEMHNRHGQSAIVYAIERRWSR